MLITEEIAPAKMNSNSNVNMERFVTVEWCKDGRLLIAEDWRNLRTGKANGSYLTLSPAELGAILEFSEKPE